MDPLDLAQVEAEIARCEALLGRQGDAGRSQASDAAEVTDEGRGGGSLFRRLHGDGARWPEEYVDTAGDAADAGDDAAHAPVGRPIEVTSLLYDPRDDEASGGSGGSDDGNAAGQSGSPEADEAAEVSARKVTFDTPEDDAGPAPRPTSAPGAGSRGKPRADGGRPTSSRPQRRPPLAAPTLPPPHRGRRARARRGGGRSGADLQTSLGVVGGASAR